MYIETFVLRDRRQISLLIFSELLSELVNFIQQFNLAWSVVILFLGNCLKLKPNNGYWLNHFC